MTNAAKAEIEHKLRVERSAHKWATIFLTVGILASLGFNSLSAVKHVNMTNMPELVISMIIAAFPPLSLFGCSMLLERMQVNRPIQVLLAIAAVVAGSFSWYHIGMVCLDYHQPWWIAWTFPAIVDIPMVLAGFSLIQLNTPQTPQTTTSVAKKTASPKKAQPSTNGHAKVNTLVKA